MTRVLLLHGGEVPHYRVPVYSHLSRGLANRGYDLTVASSAIQKGNPHAIDFPFIASANSIRSIARILQRGQFDAVILFVNMRHLYLFPVYGVAKGLLGCKMLWWGQGRDLAHPHSPLKNLAYWTEHALCDAIVLYAEHLRKYILPRFRRKTFIANNTLAFTYRGLPPEQRADVLRARGIGTPKNIICIGRFQKRKRIDRLIAAYQRLARPDIGLVLVGPDTDGVLQDVEGPGIFKLGPVYGDERFDLLSACDVYCLPGAVGLSIVDAFFCGLPFVTEEGDESAEIAYLRHGENGFVVPRGDVDALAASLTTLLDDAALRARFSAAARREIAENGSIDRLCEGFVQALRYAIDGPARARVEG